LRNNYFEKDQYSRKWPGAHSLVLYVYEHIVQLAMHTL